MKRVTILAMALAAVAALALPAAASATWKHGHSQAIQQDVQIGLTGTEIGFQTAVGSVTCQITSRAKFTAGQTTGHVETFVPHPTDATTNCKGAGGLAFCQIHNVEATDLPWVIHTVPNTTTISITSGDIHSTPTGGFCPLEWITVTPTTAIATTDTHTVSTLTLSGSVEVDIQTKGQLFQHPNGQQTHQRNGQIHKQIAQIHGTLHVEAPNAGTYSI